MRTLTRTRPPAIPNNKINQDVIPAPDTGAAASHNLQISYPAQRDDYYQHLHEDHEYRSDEGNVNHLPKPIPNSKRGHAEARDAVETEAYQG